jgi:HK97 family phage major capsid protein/HK97 family phage prohead protease
VEKKMTMIRRTSVTDGEGMDFVLSDGSLDRHGTRINPQGWVLESFRKNPIALFGHQSSFPIGTWADIRIEKGELRARLEPAEPGTSARVDEIVSLIRQRILRATSVGFDPLKEGKPGKSSFDFEEQELLEASVVSVPSNKNSLALARALHISDETLSIAFGEHADTGRVDAGSSLNGGHADLKTAAQMRARVAALPRPKEKKMTVRSLSQRIEDAQSDLVAKRDKLVELNGADDLDLDAIDEMNGQLEVCERTVATLKTSEQRIGINAGQQQAVTGSPGIARLPLGSRREVNGMDLLVKSIVARGVSHFGRKPIDQVLEERYPGHDAVAVFTRADQTIGTTTVAGWALELVQTVNQGFLDALMPVSIYPSLRAKGTGVSFDGIGTVSLPSRTAGGAGGGFTAEGAPIRVGRITTAAITMTPKKLGVIVAFSRELAKRSTPAIEGLVRQAIIEDTAVILDAALIDAVAVSTARPAGLLNGVASLGGGFGGGDYLAVLEDFKALLAPFFTANAADNLVVLMNPAQGLALAMMPGPDGVIGSFMGAIRERVTFLESTTIPAGRLIALRASDFATATGDTPDFDVSESATIHMEDAVPLEIVSGTPTVADPVRSLWQTNSIGVRMIQDISWMMRRSGMVQFIDPVSW